MGFIDLVADRSVEPGDTIETEVTFWLTPELKAKIYAGRTWRIQEGLKLVGIGTILKVLDDQGGRSE